MDIYTHFVPRGGILNLNLNNGIYVINSIHHTHSAGPLDSSDRYYRWIFNGVLRQGGEQIFHLKWLEVSGSLLNDLGGWAACRGMVI